MRKIFAISLMAALVLASCSPKEQFTPTPAPVDQVPGVRAIIETATRTALVEDTDVYHVVWKAGDEIRCTDNANTRVFYETADNDVTNAFFHHVATDTTALCPDSTKFWAFYPSTVFSKLPTVQQYVAGSLDRAPMRGFYERAEGDPFEPVFAFKNLCGAVRLNLTTTQADVKVVKIVLQADAGLSGSFSATNAAPAAVMSSATAPVSLDCPEVAIGTEAVPFYISVPEYAYKAFSVTVIASDGRTQTRSLKSGEELVVTRSQIVPIDLEFNNLVKPAVGATATFMKGFDMNTAIKSLVNPDVANYSDDDSTVTKMVFVTNSDAFSADNVADVASESPIYVFYDEATTTVTVSTPAPKFVMNANSAYFFHRFKALTEIEGIEDFDASNVQSMAYFWGFSPKQNITMPEWDYSSLINTRYMFDQVAAETIDLSKVDFSQDTSMAYMFYYAENLSELIWPDVIDASCLETMASMFRGCSLARVDLTPFENTDGLMNMRYTFAYCPNLQKVISSMNLEAIQVDSPAGMCYTFYYCSSNAGLLDLTEFDVSTLRTLAYTFYRCEASTLDLSTWNTENVTSMNYMFYQCYNLGNLYLGPLFYPTSVATSSQPVPTPTNFTGGTSDKTSGIQTASVPGSLTIYCTQETADWLVYTLLRKIYWGSYTGTPTPIYFFDIENQSNALTVEWQPA